jgi:putative hydrolase of the HAD superfamily
VAFRAVIFDLGGVVLGSPLRAIAALERERGIPDGAVNRVVVETGPHGAWSRLERGELPLEEFFAAFEDECRASGFDLCARTMMERIAQSALPRPAMLEAVRRIRTAGLTAAALTNNWSGPDDGTRALEPHFDFFFESSALGLRKPDPRIYRRALAVMGVDPAAAVFLDDIGRNLKPARELGMATIRVDEPQAALAELASLLDLDLGNSDASPGG